MEYVMMRNLLTVKTWNLDVITEHESRKKNKAAEMSEAQYQIQNYEEMIRQEESNNDVKLLLIQNSWHKQ